MRRYGRLVGGGYVSRESYKQAATEATALKATVQPNKAAVESGYPGSLDSAYQRPCGRSPCEQGQYSHHGRHACGDH